MAWIKTKRNFSYASIEPDAVVAMNNVTPVNSETIILDIGGQVVICGVEVTIAGAAVAANLVLQGSYNEVDWINVKTINADVDPEVTGVKQYVVDLRDTTCPYFRLRFNDGGAAVGTAGRFDFVVASQEHFYERSL